ncbi:hypothetical protein [Bradyrhizobium cenepequi]|uniref:hypothetical protein n=1 Tax=Bradyrhizobium cenepequi TaxID=2821403 RepID=UPI001CE343E2|nr:hypothetical protein [Bradyrhizobium cenepequi]MCA6109612.1 hypothetical protein [Bradyrhizobium cenepequi]
MDSLIEYGMWPLAAVIVAVFAMLIFRAPLSGLLNRTKRIGAGGQSIDFADGQTTDLQQIQAQSAQPPNQIANHPLGPAAATVAEIEQQVIQRLSTVNETTEARQQRLIRAFAVTVLQRDFEATYRIIFGSQLEMLLRANAGGADENVAKSIFENAKATYPNIHSSASIDDWLSYPTQANLIEKQNGLFVTTPRGKEFLQYLVQVGLTAPKKG